MNPERMIVLWAAQVACHPMSSSRPLQFDTSQYDHTADCANMQGHLENRATRISAHDDAHLCACYQDMLFTPWMNQGIHAGTTMLQRRPG